MHHNSIFDLEIHKNGSQVVTASGDTTSVLFDLVKEKRIINFCGHKKSIKAIKAHPSYSSIFATAGRDGKILLWDLRLNTGAISLINQALAEPLLLDPKKCLFPEGAFFQQKIKQNKCRSAHSKKNLEFNPITGVVFYQDSYLISTESNEDFIKIWDIRKLQNQIKSSYFYDLSTDSFQPNFTAGLSWLKKKKTRVYKNRDPFLVAKFHHCSSKLLHSYNILQNIKLSSKSNSQIEFENLSKKHVFEDKFNLKELLCESGSSENNTEFENTLLESSEKKQIKKLNKLHLIESTKEASDPLSYTNTWEHKYKQLNKTIEEETNSNIKGYCSIFLSKNENKLLVNTIDHKQILFNMNSLEIESPRIFTGHKSSYFGKFIRIY